MKPNLCSSAKPGQRGITVVELLILVSCLLLLAALFLPRLAKAKARSSKINCTNNLKQIGLSFRSWALDYNDQFPMQVAGTNGGTLEFVQSGSVSPHFRAMSNELSTPKILACPEDLRAPATNFASGFSDRHISYFVNVDAVAGDPIRLLAGDRNLTNQPPLGERLVYLSSNSPPAWTMEIHRAAGNLLFADGSVQQRANSGVTALLQFPPGATNRLAVPGSD
jgi:prepilin-type processing-associated H-X9-DG protein